LQFSAFRLLSGRVRGRERKGARDRGGRGAVVRQQPELGAAVPRASQRHHAGWRCRRRQVPRLAGEGGQGLRALRRSVQRAERGASPMAPVEPVQRPTFRRRVGRRRRQDLHRPQASLLSLLGRANY
jgi:hypothetical protein